MSSFAALPRPEHVGILAMEAYFPSRFVTQVDLEAADGCKGKYTSGLGQDKLAFVDDREDIGSVFLSALANLLEKYGIDPNDVGRLEVGTETLIDKSKSIKTTLMQLLGGNTSVEGVSSTNACYGGTAALFNSVAWVQSEDWDGRYAVVVCGDIAVYEAPAGQACGSARATQGCGAVAMLVGADAPLPLEAGLRHSHVMDVYDFYKPHHSEYAAVDGAVSQSCYLASVDACYKGFKAKARTKELEGAETVEAFDFLCFHSPYHKLVQKGFGRLLFGDFTDRVAAARAPGGAPLAEDEPLLKYADMAHDKSLTDRFLATALAKLAAAGPFDAKMAASSACSKEVGNTYTGAVFVNLLSLICLLDGCGGEEGGGGAEAAAGDDPVGEALEGKRVGMFSYGSGSVATLYALRPRRPTGASKAFTLTRVRRTVRLAARLAGRKQATVEEFSGAMKLRAAAYGKPGYEPVGAAAGSVAPGAFYLASVSDKHHRAYARQPK